MDIKSLILYPDRFFQEVGTKPNNYYPLIIAILLQTIGAVLPLLQNLSLGTNSTNIVLIFITIVTIVIILACMMLSCLTIYAILYFMNLKNISFKKIVEIVAYGYIIFAFGDIAIIILNYLGSSSIPQWLSYLIYIVFAIWACLIWAKGIQYAYALKFNKSLIPAVIAGVIELLIFILGS
jgi:hypothetical protein